jgi:predicted esterase
MAAARAALQAVGIEVACETRPGLAHAIDEEGLARAGAFLAAAFVPATT